MTKDVTICSKKKIEKMGSQNLMFFLLRESQNFGSKNIEKNE